MSFRFLPLLAACTSLAVPAFAAQRTPALAAQVCNVLHEQIAERQTACCASLPTRSNLAPACTEALGSALQRGQLQVDHQALRSCQRQLKQELRGCDWIGPLQPALPESCQQILKGRLSAGDPCISGLECTDGLYCRGPSGGPGLCAAPAKAGQACELPADPLAALTIGNAASHRGCEGSCVRGLCLAPAPLGASCGASAQCAAGLNCLAGSCSKAALPEPGQACSATSSCAGGAICVNALCVAPKAAGASCSLPFECRSLECSKAPGASQGVCAATCPGG